jgi:diguanylate cyclase (GGDEF)-like protein/PAS domain S-box-containing protein
MADGRLGPDFYEALVEGSSELVCAFDASGRVVFASSASTAVVGWTPDEMVGRNVADLLHPDDLERALLGAVASSELGAPGGTSSFRVLCADGDYTDVDMSVGNVDLGDGSERLVSVSCRPGDYQHGIDEMMQHLLDGGAASAADTFRPVLDAIAWKPNGSRVAIAWFEDGAGHQAVSTGLPIELTGAEPAPGDPWARARAHGVEVAEEWPVALDPVRAALARDLELGGLWVVPVADPGSGVAALITVWTRAGRPVRGHAYGMSVATRFTEVIVRWRYQIGRLEQAAYRDPLTGLGNRQVFFDVLDREHPSGALLYCDLDRFKPVNDELGHAAGDDVLRHVATRLRSCVRAEDLLARIGGDEFVILLRGASVEQATALADRITAAFAEPFDVAGTCVDLGISIGIAHTDGGLTEENLDAADRALYEQKARRLA